MDDRVGQRFGLFDIHGHNLFPNFVAKLSDGRILIVEYKGKPFLNDDTREKENIGQLWEEKAKGKDFSSWPPGWMRRAGTRSGR